MARVRIIIILTFLSLLFSTTSWGETEYDFRKTRWGMTKKEVEASESERLLEEAKENIETPDHC